jgi:hypothetical protein
VRLIARFNALQLRERFRFPDLSAHSSHTLIKGKEFRVAVRAAQWRINHSTHL